MFHKFRIGQRVRCVGSRSNSDIPPGVHVITAELPERDGEVQYQVTCVVSESELIDGTFDISSMPGTLRVHG
jgi:hypothetical protein